jgi:hypothetical protein
MKYSLAGVPGNFSNALGFLGLSFRERCIVG